MKFNVGGVIVLRSTGVRCVSHYTVVSPHVRHLLLHFWHVENTGAHVASAYTVLAVGVECWLSGWSVCPPCLNYALLRTASHRRTQTCQTSHIVAVVRFSVAGNQDHARTRRCAAEAAAAPNLASLPPCYLAIVLSCCAARPRTRAFWD